MSRLVARGLLILALAGGVALPLVPCVPPSALVTGTARAAAYAAGSVICHQRPERSWHRCGTRWPVCARCSGLYLGAAAGALLALGGVARGTGWRRWRVLVAGAGVPTAVLWLAEAAGLLDPGNVGRFVAALPLGGAAALWLGALARGEFD